MKTLGVFLLFSCLLAFSFSGCKKNDPPNSDLYQKWTLTSIQDTKSHKTINYPDTTRLFEIIDFTDTALLINGACANYGQAYYSVKKDSITFTKISIFHLLYCDLYQWEQSVLNNLDSAYKYTINGRAHL